MITVAIPAIVAGRAIPIPQASAILSEVEYPGDEELFAVSVSA
jgi:hypothetical protein